MTACRDLLIINVTKCLKSKFQKFTLTVIIITLFKIGKTVYIATNSAVHHN